jgi:chromosome segregation protein
MKEFGDVSSRDEFLARELGDLDKAHASLVGIITELETEMSRRFDEGMIKINTTFNQFFSTMFDGGSAALVLETPKSAQAASIDEDNEGEGDVDEIQDENGAEEMPGVEVKVSLPRKRVHSLAMLSGGERALTSIALLFALSQVTPPPFIILDETDAALDESNSRKYGDMIEALGKHSQLLLITHNRETMSRAGVLYGVTMSRDGASTILSVRFEDALAVAK